MDLSVAISIFSLVFPKDPEWFRNDYMKLNEDKCHFMIFGERTNQDVGINIGNCTVNNSQEEKLLGVLIDSNLNFEKHVSNICKKLETNYLRCPHI